MRNKTFFLSYFIFIFLILSSSLALAIQTSGPYAYNIVELPVFNNATAAVNSSEFWLTNIGALDDVNTTQFSNVGGALTIIESWIKAVTFQDPMTTIGDIMIRDGVNQTARLGIGPTAGSVLTQQIGGALSWDDSPRTIMGGNGDLLVTNALGNLFALAAGNTGQVLTINGSSIPSWENASTGGGVNPFNQSLNTTDNVTFVNVTASFYFGDGSQLSNLPATTPAGSDTEIQFNDGGVFGAVENFTWDKNNNQLTLRNFSLEQDSNDLVTLNQPISDADFRILVRDGGATRTAFYVDSSNKANIGFKTETPAADLHILSAPFNAVSLRLETTASNQLATFNVRAPDGIGFSILAEGAARGGMLFGLPRGGLVSMTAANDVDVTAMLFGTIQSAPLILGVTNNEAMRLFRENTDPFVGINTGADINATFHVVTDDDDQIGQIIQGDVVQVADLLQFRDTPSNIIALFDNAANLNFLVDNQKVFWGAGSDSSITYSGTDMEFDSQEVGTGDFHFLNGNAGFLTTNPTSALHTVSFATAQETSIGAVVNLDETDHTRFVSASDDPVTVNLPTSIGIGGRIYIIKKIDSSGNAVTIDGFGSQTIDDVTTHVLNTQNEFVSIQSDNSNWDIISQDTLDINNQTMEDVFAINFSNGAQIKGNATCLFLISPDESTTLEICDV